MKLGHLIAAASIALLPLTASAASLVIPAAGTGAGNNGTKWQSEVTLHNTSASDINATLVFHDTTGAGATATVKVPARGTVSVADIVATKFNVPAGVGAVEIKVTDAEAGRLTITSRTSTTGPNGDLGQDIPAINVTDALKAGDMAVIAGPSDVTRARFNFGAYAVADTIVRWQLVRADGTIETTNDRTYGAGQQIQYTGGVEAFFNATAKNNDVLHATIAKGSAILYGSVIDQLSNDPTYVPAIRTREDIRTNFQGVDRDGNGSIDISDANHDGVLDAPIDAYTLGFPTYFRVVVGGEKLNLSILSSTADARLLDDQGNIQIVASGALKGTTGELKLRVASLNGQVDILTIPMTFR